MKNDETKLDLSERVVFTLEAMVKRLMRIPPRRPNRPPGFSMTKAYYALRWAGVCLIVWLFVWAGEFIEHWFDDPELQPHVSWLVWPAALWLVAVAAFYARFTVWKRRLPFALEGYDSVAGDVPNDDWHDQIMDVAVRVELADAAASPTPFLDALVARANAHWHADEDRRRKLTPFLVVVADDGAAATAAAPIARGTCASGLYTDRVFARWLRVDVPTIARESGVAVRRVVFDARFTDEYIWID